ncbi:hypothetical protein [Streptomyces badius]|uniref:Uncharacterized protein n=1 Tax=Streptomyces badius TaxID=1941 RepID=A0ABQ2TEX8_STRBA|nr:hypothetical protein [Streptomyces badius]GGS63666.1 hypothetical protein GCM10010253_43270 [Streptomyces badius]
MIQPGQTYQVGDTVRFTNATLPANRTRDYEITAVHPDGINVTAKGHGYFLTHEQADHLGITKKL